MILGTEPRVRTMVNLVERSRDVELAPRPTSPVRDHRSPVEGLDDSYTVASESM